ncbi:MAG: hypothetical protein IJ867_07175, partial [Clostridia bacterium]|nr:hypothetical protein [Clostridia bacterium]
ASEKEKRGLAASAAAGNLENTKYKGVTIPAGFAPSQIEGEDTIEEGLVVIDKFGNEFVWIPVDLDEGEDFETKYPRTLFENNSPSTDLSDNSSFVEPYGLYENENDEYRAMIESVNKYKGFYIARYEAGKEEKNNTIVAVSKKDVEVWNNIAWGTSMREIGTEGAVYQAKNMYSQADNIGVVSTLVYGIQWDMILRYVKENEKYNVTDSKLWGNFVGAVGDAETFCGVIQTSGKSEFWKAKNIYDLAGNVQEWTMEGKGASRVRRGATYVADDLDEMAASYRSPLYPETNNKAGTGFRVALYIK